MSITANIYITAKVLFPGGKGEIRYVYLNAENKPDPSAGEGRLSVPSARALEKFEVGKAYVCMFYGTNDLKAPAPSVPQKRKSSAKKAKPRKKR